MLNPTRNILGFRTLAIIPIVLFMPSLVSFAVAPGTVVVEYTGVLFHIAFLFLVSRMIAPLWAKAAGFGWLTLDVLCGIMMINNAPYDIAWDVRLGGHVLAGTWILTTSMLASSRSVTIVGAITGITLGGYSFVGNVLPPTFLYPGGLLLIVWLILLAVKYDPDREAARFTTAVPTTDGQRLG